MRAKLKAIMVTTRGAFNGFWSYFFLEIVMPPNLDTNEMTNENKRLIK